MPAVVAWVSVGIYFLELVVNFVLFCASCSFITYYRTTCYSPSDNQKWEPPEAAVAVAGLVITASFLHIALFFWGIAQAAYAEDSKDETYWNESDGAIALAIADFLMILYWVAVILRGTIPEYTMNLVTYALKNPNSGCWAPTTNHLALVCVGVIIAFQVTQLLIAKISITWSIIGPLWSCVATAGLSIFDCLYTRPRASLRQIGERRQEVGPSAINPIEFRRQPKKRDEEVPPGNLAGMEMPEYKRYNVSKV